jgi:hypothetical protein
LGQRTAEFVGQSGLRFQTETRGSQRKIADPGRS